MSKPENPRLFRADEKIDDGDYAYSSRVTLLDLFAGLCAAGLNTDSTRDMASEQLAKVAYGDAEALLSERARRQKDEADG